MAVIDAPSPDGSAGHPDSAVDRLWRGRAGVARTEDDGLRRTQGRELLVVLLIFPLGAAFSAVADFVLRIQIGHDVVGRSAVVSTSSWTAAVLASVGRLSGLAPAVLVAYLLGLSGERLASIGLDRHRLRMDFALVLPVFLLVQW